MDAFADLVQASSSGFESCDDDLEAILAASISCLEGFVPPAVDYSQLLPQVVLVGGEAATNGLLPLSSLWRLPEPGRDLMPGRQTPASAAHRFNLGAGRFALVVDIPRQLVVRDPLRQIVNHGSFADDLRHRSLDFSRSSAHGFTVATPSDKCWSLNVRVAGPLPKVVSVTTLVTADNSTAKHVANQVRVLRAALRITQRQLAARARVATLTVQRVESGQHSASITTLDKIAAALEVTTRELVSGDPTEEN